MKRKKTCWGVIPSMHAAIVRFGLVILCISILAGTTEATEGRKFKIVHSNNLQGYVLPCPT